ncbi:15-hydroxyprostaglandin dehydrogenase [Eumeta japonica]|uniref:15-hydroxyprostaglandin dehydrogenase n=1 Tax=Eumeta variegata TaxID=151549 RepID=A0A4C1UZR0_EUMVA|nr:15-hydroxyprostaglandin dehydrogenase [Eumeta japonica]
MAVYEVKDKVFIVTGGAIGLGALTVKAFLEEGAKYVACLDVDKDAGVALEAELKAKHGANRIKFIKCDVTKDEELYGAYDTVMQEQGYVDVVVNNAGIMNDSKAMYKKAVLVNVAALITSTMKAMELMSKENGGRGGTVVNISSETALTQQPALPVYFATKSAVLQFSNCIGMEPNFLRTGVRVITVCYGATATTLLSPEKIAAFDETTNAMMKNVMTRPAMHIQSPENAIAGLVQLFKMADSGSTWYVGKDKPAADITSSVKEAYSILTKSFSD